MDDFEAYANFLTPLADRPKGVDILPSHVYGEGKYGLLGRHDTYQYEGGKRAIDRENPYYIAFSIHHRRTTKLGSHLLVKSFFLNNYVVLIK
ncbi:MAG: hypothetical protein J7K66_05905 [Anaerolineaceae bacterium]|nr:hypothetical protein [Anaerolineaceae bacterium]